MSYALATRLRRPVVFALSLALLVGPATPAFAQGNCSGGVSASPPVDNRDGFLVNFEEAPIHPLEFGSTGELWQANLPDARIVVWNLAAPLAPAKLDEIGVGLGPVSIRLRPAAGANPREIWVACQSSNAVFVIDEATRRVIKSVRLIGEPTDVAFDAANQFAYVSLAAKNRIAKVDANTLAVQTPLTYDSDYPPGGAARAEVEEPRAMMRDGNTLFVLSHLSGNGSFPASFDLIDPDIVNGWQFGATPPDRDVLAFDLATGAPGSAALWRMGTLNFDLVKADDGRTYVSTVDFGNQTVAPPGTSTIEGEFDYKAKGFGRHLITHAVAGTNGFPQTGTLGINLNVDVDPLLPTSFRCAVPTDIAYDSVAERLFVACYETRNVAVVQLNTTAAGGTVIAELLPAPLATPRPEAFGPRGVALSANGLTAYVYYRGDHRLQAFDLTGLGAGSRIAPAGVAPLKAGFDITPQRILNGRRHFLNAANSGTGTSTCNTCHMDGHLDGIGWDLSDFTGKLDSTPAPEKVGREPKGTKVTMSLRGIEETPPFHWRGDRADLDAFNPAFAGLLGGATLTSLQMREFEDFVFGLSYPANPNLADNRAYTAFAKDGFDCFSTHKTMHTVLHDATGGPPPGGNPNGNLDISCAGCHAMDGASGTLNQVNNPFPVTMTAIGDDATQLRGLWDKESQTVTTGLPAPMDVIPATGWGFANTGVVDSVINFINIGVFNHMGHDLQIEKFMKEMDTGVAPTAAFAVMLTGGTTTTDEALLTSTLAAAQPLTAIANGAVNFPAHDLIVRGWVRLVVGGPQVPIGMLWNGTLFQTDRTGVTYTLARLKSAVANGDAAVALIGVPVGSGYRLGIDRDLDFRLDGDEVSVAPTTATDNPDSDGDTFPDGYEIRLGSNPALAGSVPPVELIAPQVLTNKIAWINSNVVKARWSTDEESTTRLRVWKVGPGPIAGIVYDREDSQFKKYHSAVGRKLEPGGSYRVEAITKDPRGNTRTVVLNAGVPSQPFLFLSTQVAKTTLTRTGPGTAPGTQAYTATAAIVDETGAAIADGAMVSGRLVEWDAGACTFTPGVTPPGTCSTATNIPAVATLGGVATFTIQGVRNFALGTAEFFVTGVVDNTPSSPNPGLARLYFKPLSGQFGFWGQDSVP